MNTSFEEVKDVALFLIRDSRIDNLFKTDHEVAVLYTDGLLRNALLSVNGNKSEGDIKYDFETKEFDKELSDSEKNLIAHYMAIVWFKTIIQNTTSLKNAMSNSAFKRHSGAEDLKQKKEYLIVLQEEAQNLQTKIDIRTFEW